MYNENSNGRIKTASAKIGTTHMVGLGSKEDTSGTSAFYVSTYVVIMNTKLATLELRKWSH